MRASVMAVAMLIAGGSCVMRAETECVHLSASFDFEIAAPFATAATFFGPESEKGWAGERWQPKFMYPQPGKDVHGTVFTVQHGSHASIWVNTVYDEAAGRMQYVAVIPDVVATTVDVTLTRISETRTRVDVTYVRTALNPAANDDVRGLVHRDAASGPEWESAIAGMLKGK